MFKRQEGITLVALVITIIVLLILAGVTISLLFSEDSGIITRAQEGAQNYTNAAIEENAMLHNVDLYINGLLTNLTAGTSGV